MKRALNFALLFFLFCHFSFSQNDFDNERQSVLEKNQIGKPFVFDRSNDDIINKLELVYLGDVQTNDGRIFKILTSIWYWGLSSRATSRILIYNDNNQYLGSYYVSMTTDLPNKVENNCMFFYNDGKKKCDSKLVTRVSFSFGIQQQFFLKCKDQSGDIYTFN